VYPSGMNLNSSQQTQRLLLRASQVAIGAMLVCAALIALDPRELVGEPVWLKPTKFWASIVIYGLSLRWVLARTGLEARWVSRIVVLTFGIEMLAICGQAARGVRSHFNVATGPDAAVFAIMGVAIAVFWVANAVLTWSLFKFRPPESARPAWEAARWGMLLFLAGAWTGQPMTMPNAAQKELIRAGAGLESGAHSIGLADSAARHLPITGWNADAGDLRVPHFVGMHFLQVLIGLLWLGERLGTERKRLERMLRGGAALGGAVFVTSLVQAFQGRTIVSTEGPFVAVYATMTALGVIWVIGSSR